jgi:norsolorinic acid ketoreductase
MSQAWFISGANRGIGFELVKIVANLGHTVFAGVRTPSKATALQNLASKNPNIYILQLESTSVSDATNAAQTISEITGGLDVVVANAGIANNWQKALDLDLDSVYEHLKVNAVGPLILFRALYPLLLKRETRKFVPVSTVAASSAIVETLPVPGSVYGSSKAALNYITRNIHKEHFEEGFIVFPIHPGMVGTDMGESAAPLFGLEKMPLSPFESAEAVFNVVNGATKEQSGRFLSYDGTELPW